MLRVCIIGICGHSKTAYATLRARGDVTFCGIAPGSEHEKETVGLLDPTIPLYEDYCEMLDREKPDLALVSPVFGLTGRVILACAKRGVNVFSEKPIAATIEELAAVEQAVRKSGIAFCAMHYLRTSPAFYHAAEMVARGEIGNLRLMTAQKSYRYGTRPDWYGDRSLYGGTIPWVGIHAIDWLWSFSHKRFLSVKALSYGNPEKAALCQFEMEDGVMASVNLDYYRPSGAEGKADDRIRCAGERGVLEVFGGKITLMNERETRVLTPQEAPDLLESFLQGRPIVTPEEIFYLTRVVLLARESADTGRVIQIKEHI